VSEPSVREPLEQDAVAEHTVAISAGISDLAHDHGAQLLQSTATEHLYATGLKSEDEPPGEVTEPGPESRAAEFVMHVGEWIREAAESTGLGFEFRGGLAAGDVVAGVVGTDRIAFTVWGTPRRRAVELASVAKPDQILVDQAVAAGIGDTWLVEPMADLVDFKGGRLDGWRIVGARADE
jgi:class 3 adenylate cyclase